MAIDLQNLMLLQNLRNATGGIFNDFFLYITTCAVDPFVLFVLFSIYWAVDKDLGQTMLFGYNGGNFMNGVLKLTACMYRPWIRSDAIVPAGDAKVAATGYSFPSGHSTCATAVYGTASYHYRKQRALSILFLVVLLLILFSRNFLGVHTPEDVIVGFSCTAVVVYLLYRARMWAEKGKNRDLILLAVCVALIVISLIYFAVKSYPLDVKPDGSLVVDPAKMTPNSYDACGGFLGMLIGWILERRYIRFSSNGSGAARAARCIGGMLLILVLNTVLYSAFAGLGKNWGKFTADMFLMFICTAVYPAIFKKIEVAQGHHSPSEK